MFKQYIVLLLTLSTLLFSASVHSNFFDDVSQAYIPTDVNEIIVGDGTAPIIEIEAHTPLPLGVAVILTSSYPSSLTLAQGQSLGSALAEKGWNVLISPLSLPIEKMAITSIGTNSSSSNTNSNDTAAASIDKNRMASDDMNESNMATEGLHPRSSLLFNNLDFQQATTNLAIHLNALNNHLQSRPGYRLYIAQGMSAASYLSAIQIQPDLQPDSFIAVSPFWPETLINSRIIKNIAKSSYPILDISIEGLSEWELNTAPERKKRSKNELKLHYRQVKIPRNLLTFSINKNQKNPHIQSVANSTIGWTRYLGW
ncbi:hypothetical protein MTsDn1_23380 [Alteromonas sp. MTD1]|uniref:DUF3530 family protein n=1 Tax=Alteromonas sp. MTD1 TaxID=3057962 RepID=UPI0036F37F82